MKRGKQTCRILKEIRRQIAEANDIEFITSECQYKEDCLGTCPKCEAEVRYLEQELEHRRMTGKLVTLAGISAGMLTMNTYAQSGGSGNTITSSSKIELQDSLKPSKEAIIIGYIPVQQYDETDRCTVPVKQTKISKIEIAGSVKDECGNVLLGASIREKGTNNGTRSQTDGTFSLQVSGKYPVIVSCIGYSPIKIPVKLLSDSLQIILEELWEGEVMPMTEYNGNSKRKNIIPQPDAHRHRRDASDHGEPAGSHLAQANHRGIVSAGIRGCRAQSHRQAGHGRAGWRMGGQSCGKVAIDATVMALALGLSGRRHRGAGRCRRHVAGGRAPQNR